MPRQVELIGAAWGLGGPEPGCAEAPAVLIPLLVEQLQRFGVSEPRCVARRGGRSSEPEERERLERLGVRVSYMDEIRSRGIAAVLDEALGIATRGTAAFGVSIDLDVVSPDEAPGVGTPVPD